MIPRKKSSVRIATNEKTKASVAARPTPSAPARQLKLASRRNQPIAAEKHRFGHAAEELERPDVFFGMVPVVQAVDAAHLG